jgi:TorA maturation chaperone TorD
MIGILIENRKNSEGELIKDYILSWGDSYNKYMFLNDKRAIYRAHRSLKNGAYWDRQSDLDYTMKVPGEFL